MILLTERGRTDEKDNGNGIAYRKHFLVFLRKQAAAREFQP